MSIEGSINVSALFHDRDGTTAMKVVSLRSSDEYTTGKVAIVTGTVGTTALSLWSSGGLGFGGYRDAAGNLVSIGQVTRIVLRCNTINDGVQIKDADLGKTLLWHNSTRSAVCENDGGVLTIEALANTQSFTAILYGT